ncbi:MAG: sugar transferase [Candidatus Shapirobacteria bacterium]|jgi:lipopolysaccharide/colanic/teichoic acid biosynthesis glycosyltransferase
MINEKSHKLFLKQRIELFNLFKRSIDIFGSIFLIFLFSPIMLVTAVLVKLSSPGPIFFKQQRVGKSSKPFHMFKFRSMYIGDNDKRLKENYPDLWDKYKKSGWKLPMNEDPRITPVGKKIRSLTIDEFPQLFNVLKGEMSLTGPRAYREEELKEYEAKYPLTKKYIDDIRSVKPGITGPWQTSGRNALNFEDRAKLDSHYVRTLSVRQELLILIKTPLAMISRW